MCGTTCQCFDFPLLLSSSVLPELWLTLFYLTPQGQHMHTHTVTLTLTLNTFVHRERCGTKSLMCFPLGSDLVTVKMIAYLPSDPRSHPEGTFHQKRMVVIQIDLQ